MEENIEGLQSLKKRIKKLESQSLFEDVEDDLIEILQRRQKQNKKSKLNELNEVYLYNLLEKVQNTSKNNFFNVLQFTVQFVEENINNISLVLQTKICDELRDIVCIDLLNRLYNNEFSEEFIQISINGFRNLTKSNKCECEYKNIDKNIDKKTDKKKGFFKK